MARASLTLHYLNSAPEYEIFDFDYPFYSENHKKGFEKKFIMEYEFEEIGFPTPYYFKRRLENRLNLIMPRYQQLYLTQIEALKINFLLNKDLEETTIVEAKSKGTNQNNNNNSGENTNDNTNLFSETPQGKITDIEEYLTNATKDNSLVKYNETSDSSGLSENESSEKTTLISKGNIGVTSSGDLLKSWRETIINIDEMIINELSDLFLQVYN